MAKLKPIGEGSDVWRNGYDFTLLVSWLENIREHELELADEKPAYTKRAHRLSDLVDELNSLDTSSG